MENSPELPNSKRRTIVADGKQASVPGGSAPGSAALYGQAASYGHGHGQGPTIAGAASAFQQHPAGIEGGYVTPHDGAAASPAMPQAYASVPVEVDTRATIDNLSALIRNLQV